MRKTRKPIALTSSAVGFRASSLTLAGLLLVGASSLHAATFEEQRATIAASIESQSEQAISSLLTAGIEENRPASAAALASEWLRRNLPKNATVLFKAARAAELGGETKNAVAYYQQALKLADPKSAEASEAITAVYTLLIYRLQDTTGAYVFSQNEASRLAVNPNFRQFDRWFLDQAKTRNDREAVAERLITTINSGATEDVIVALYASDLYWILNSIRAVRYDLKPDRFTPNFTAKIKSLATAIKFDPELSLLLDWSVSVKAYNMAKIDGKEVSAPLAEVKKLLEKYPHYASLVQTDWAGGSNSRHYRDDPKKYWLHDTEAKLAPIRAALTKLSPLDQAELLRTWSTNYYDSGPQVISAVEAPAFILANKDLVNKRTGPILSFQSDKITVAQAAELSPHLALNPSPEASLIRAFAVAGETKDLDKAVAALLGAEAWRLERTDLDGRLADRLWTMTGRPGNAAKRDEVIAKAKALAATIPTEDTENQFSKLLEDYLSPAPKTPALRSRLIKLINDSPDLISLALGDTRLEAQLFVRDAILADLANPNGVIKTKANKKKNINPKPVDAHPLEPDLRKALSDTLAKNKLESWLVTSWIKTLNSNKFHEAAQLAESILKSPAFSSLSYDARFSLRNYAPEKSLTTTQVAILDSTSPEIACADLTTLPATADAPAVIAALTKAIAVARKSPTFFELQGLDQLAVISEEAFGDEKLQSFLVDLIDNKLAITPTQAFANRLFAVLITRDNPSDLLRTSGYLWKHVAIFNRTYPAMLTLAESTLDTSPAVSYAFANEGLAAIERHSTGHTWFSVTDITRLKSIRSKAANKLGLIVIPVPPTHPTYPVYQAQAEWMSGNEDSAWKLLETHWDVFATSHRDLSISFLMWTLQRSIFSRDEARQEFLVKSLIAWSGEAGSPLTATEKATIELAYGDIALQRGQLPQAHDIYTRTSKNPAYAELPIRHLASLRRVRAERMAKNYDAALQTLTDLELERVPEIWTEVRFARAEVYFDREDFDDAKDDVDSILARDPNHADSRILLGKIQLKRQKLMEATEVELGSSSSQKTLFPGERLKVTLSDPTLAVSGAGTEIEVVVWAISGDKETFFLRQFGDEKTKFRGEVSTALGSPTAGDGILQVIGDDEVFYAYSDRFREKMNNIDQKRGGPITIASDGMLMVSARKLLTEAEQRNADMQLVMDEIGDGPNSEAAAKARIATGEVVIDHSRHIATIVKPGNPIHVRVSDPDRSRTPDMDELTVSATSSSGDSVSKIILRETSTHSGVFEGLIPTTGAQASAFAQNSEPGRTPNMVISPSSEYPAWRPVPTKNVIPDFTVDLNDNLALKELTITAREPGAKLEKFVVQTAMNPSDWTNIGTFPATAVVIEDAWKPSVMVVNEEQQKAHYGARSVYEIEQLRQHMNTGWLANVPDMAIAKNITGVSDALPSSILTDVKWMRGTYQNPAVVVRFQAYFYEKESVTRRFALDLGKMIDQKIPADQKQKNEPAEFLIAINGRPISTKGERQIQGEINLKPGIQKIEIWATGWLSNIGFGRDVKLRANLTGPETLTDCPDSFFDPSTFPPSLMDQRNGTATITSNADSTEYSVKFAKSSRARLIRIIMVSHEGTVPALNKLSLTSADGAKILPVAQDFAELNKNEKLEILTGDKISVRYIDDRFVTKSRERQERFLDVSFTDARVEFADMEPRFSTRSNEDEPYYEKLLRFIHDKPLTLAIHDADMDSTVKPDKVKVSLETSNGTKEFEAIETDDSTGIFKLVVKPILGAAKGVNEIQVSEGGVITARYMDEDNNRPGVPTPRVAIIHHAAYAEPQILLSHATVTPLEGQGASSILHDGFERLDDGPDLATERINAVWNLNQSMLSTAQAPEGGFNAVSGQRMYIEVVAPQMALGEASKITVFAQTDQGRSVAAASSEPGYNKDIPGTLLLEAGLELAKGMGDIWNKAPFVPIYQLGPVVGFGENPELDRFFISVPLILGTLPAQGALTSQERYDLAKETKDSLDPSIQVDAHVNGLVVRPGEMVHIGFRYTTKDGAEKWATASTKVVSHPAFDLLTEDNRANMTAAYVGEDLNLRVVDLGADVSEGADTVSVLAQAKSGAKHQLILNESGPHTGIFKGTYSLAYADTKPAPTAPADGSELAPYDVRINGFPVTYGDTVAARYTDVNGIKTETRMVTISRGADGTIEPFSKKYEDPEMAMRTQFSLAEAYLEVAKRRRKIGENELANLDYQTAKQLLSSAMDQFKDPSTRAHAEYLLASLTMEEAEASEDLEARETRYRAALTRFINVTGSYSETLHASKAQYQIATIYERLNEPDIAAQEYVKLAYKYPDSEYLAVSMARLGTHFLKKAADYEAKAKPLLEKAAEDKDAAFEGEALNKMAIAEYLKTAQIFGRLQERFPTDPLAGQAGLRAGQSFMRAGKNQEAVDAFKRVIDEVSYDGKTIRSQAMYWSGMCYQNLRQPMAAYSHFKRLTYDFPESEWAAYARGQLSQEGLLNLETKLELERLEGENK